MPHSRRANVRPRERHLVGPVHVAGFPLVCPHCRNDTFAMGSSILHAKDVQHNAPLEWDSPTVQNFVCTRCGRIETFLPRPGLDTDAVNL